VLTIRFKYYLLCLLLVSSLFSKAQEPNDNNQAVITIIGDDPPESSNAHDFVNTNPYTPPVDPPDKQQKVQKNQNIEPTLENGFHMRFEVSFAEPIGGEKEPSIIATADDSDISVNKKVPTLTQRTINFKKRLKKWFPARKKKYKPTLCGRF
jgi:hypothetical protein